MILGLVKTGAVCFWATLGRIGLIFSKTYVHTGYNRAGTDLGSSSKAWA